MRCFLMACAFLVSNSLCGAVVLDPPPDYVGTWPPVWVGVSKGADDTQQDPNPTPGDDSHDFDYGKDKHGYWANLEVLNSGAPVIVEMRYVNVVATSGAYRDPDYGNGPIAGAFRMGAPKEEQGSLPNERPQYVVPYDKINNENGMWVAAEECSQEFWQAVTGDAIDVNTQAHYVAGEEGQRAVDSKTFEETEQFCQRLSAIIGKDADLPTETEWEYLCRAGTATAFNTGRILDGFVGFSGDGLKVNTRNTRFNYDRAEMAAGAADSPNEDSTTPAWELNVLRITGDGIAIWENLKIPCCGELVIDSNSTMVMDIGAHFDDRYQNRYVPDHYGSYTPVLMLYKFDGTNYIPQPYGDPTDVDMYYRYLDEPREYVECDRVEAFLEQNHSHSNAIASDSPFRFQDPRYAGDWYAALGTSEQKRQLEYREMVHLNMRYEAKILSADVRNVVLAEWEERFDGKYFLLTDPAGNKRMYPVRSVYSRYQYHKTGKLPDKTLPIQPKTDDIVEQAKSIVPENQKGLNAPDSDMTTKDYVFNYWDTLADYYHRASPRPRFDPGFWEPRTSDERNNINKDDIIAMNSIWEFPRGRVQDRITVSGAESVKTGTSATARNTWGLLHVHGNLEEWTKTRWDGVSSPEKTTGGRYQVTRGGSWRTGAARCRSAARTARDPSQAYDDVGFRFIIRN